MTSLSPSLNLILWLQLQPTARPQKPQYRIKKEDGACPACPHYSRLGALYVMCAVRAVVGALLLLWICFGCRNELVDREHVPVIDPAAVLCTACRSAWRSREQTRSCGRLVAAGRPGRPGRPGSGVLKSKATRCRWSLNNSVESINEPDFVNRKSFLPHPPQFCLGQSADQTPR